VWCSSNYTDTADDHANSADRHVYSEATFGNPYTSPADRHAYSKATDGNPHTHTSVHAGNIR
jgi:hypothetical protein